MAGLVSLLVIYVLSRQIYLSASKLIMRWYGCEYMSPTEYSDLHYILNELSEKFSIECPKSHIFDSSTPIVFTVGSKKKYDIVMSYGLLELLNNDELEAMLAREMARISEGNVSHNTFVAFVAGIIASFSTVAMWMSMLGGFGQEGDPVPKFIRFVAMGLVMLPAALIVYIGSVDSTLHSDIVAVRTLGSKQYLASALKRVYNDINLNSVEYFNPGHVHLFAMNPVKVNSLYDIHLSLFEAKLDLRQRLKAVDGVDILN
ncbi:M48 family metalloprotease [Methanolobus sp. ZRKC5]|uniref:M48 family metalloprotease n=1 Tax=unclassified Methanolobus TaxID=2629569 RepID=UPI00313C30A3